jgi:hypothetical protein
MPWGVKYLWLQAHRAGSAAKISTRGVFSGCHKCFPIQLALSQSKINCSIEIAIEIEIGIGCYRFDPDPDFDPEG